MMTTTPGRVLVVDDEVSFLEMISVMLERRGLMVLTASSGEEGMNILREKPVNVVLSDQRMPGMKGSDFLTYVAKEYPKVVRILITGYSDLESAVEAINKARIRSYIGK